MEAATSSRTSPEDEVEQTVRSMVQAADGSLRGVFARRALRALAKLSRQLGEASLREAVSARSDYGVLLAALESEPGLAALTPEDPLAEARLRGIDARKRLVEAEGGSLRAQVAASLLNISRQAAYKRYRAGRLEPNAATGGKTPLAALRLGKLRDVLRAAEQHGEHGAI